MTPIFLIIAPPEGCKESNDPELKELDLFTSRLDKSLRKFQGYTVTIGWDNLSDKDSSKQNHYVVENALLKGLMVLGAVPWQVLMPKFQNEQYEQNVCFIGIDVNPRKSIAGGVILNTFGVLTAQHIVRTSLANEDKIDGDALSLLVQKLINHYRSSVGIQPKHIVIHRDGLLKDDISHLIDYLRKFKISYDMLEVKKNGTPRIRQPNNVDGIPLKDIAMGNEEGSIAYLCNTITFPEYLSTGVVFPAPDGITIHRVYGKTSMKMLAAQVFALSRATDGSYRRTEKLPATIVYADALVNHASLREYQRDFGKPINHNTRITWL